MTPRPFYRSRLFSRLFWLGLPGLVFLLWLRAACPPWMLVVEHDDRAYGLAVGVDDGLRLISMEMEMEGGGFSPHRVSFDAATGLEEIPPGLPVRFTDKWSTPAFGLVRADGVVAYSLLIPLYLALWLGALLVWQRRKSRLLKLHTAP